MEDKPTDMFATGPGLIGCYVDVWVRSMVPEGVGDEPLSVSREGTEERVDVVDALRDDDSAHRPEQALGWHQLGEGGGEEY